MHHYAPRLLLLRHQGLGNLSFWLRVLGIVALYLQNASCRRQRLDPLVLGMELAIE